ncbi:MAG: hypothetical protein NWE91_06345 [Candidatus Bathyarchaeota archaeon]|nr:hypothetical protein [Candidatus Bathyarchaeota archaeon]
MSAARDVFAAWPPIFKLLIVLAIVNGFLIANTASTQLVVFRNTAIVKSINIGVYRDVDCTSPVEAIDWGIIEPGENMTIDVYVRNEGNSELVLSIWAANWSSPEVEHYMNFTSDYQDQPIGVGDALPVALILSLSWDVRDITAFSFDVIIETRG